MPEIDSEVGIQKRGVDQKAVILTCELRINGG